MSRFILVATMLTMTFAGCDRFPDNSLQVIGNLPPNESCVLSADQEVRLLRGLYDVSYRDPSTGQPVDYRIAPLVRSFILTNALEFQGEQGNIQITDFDVTLLLADGSIAALPSGLPNPYKVSTSAVIPANLAEGQFTDEVAFAIGIPGTYQDALLAIRDATGFTSVLLDIRANGTTFGGFSQQSAPFRWPVEICEGCLDVCDIEIEISCFPGQDVWPYCTNPLPMP